MTAESLLGRKTHQIREAMLGAFSALQGKNYGGHFPIDELLRTTARALFTDEEQFNEAKKKWAPGPEIAPGGIRLPLFRQDEPAEPEDLRKLMAALWSLVAGGVVYPKFGTPHKDHNRLSFPGPVVVDWVVLTPYGEQVIANADHTRRSTFIERFQERSGPHVTDEVMTRLDDAIECQDRSLLRAALAMVGLAAEETLRTTHAALAYLIDRGTLQGKISTSVNERTNAKKVLSEIRSVLEAWPDKKSDGADRKQRLLLALGTAEAIRLARNKASHPGARMTDTEEVEEILQLAARHLPVFWRIPIAKAVDEGFTVENKD